MKIIYISENKIYKCENGKIAELPSERVLHYTGTIAQINKNKEWKNSGTGAEFMGAAVHPGSEENAYVNINGVAAGGLGIVYSMRLGDMGGIYSKSIDNPNEAEAHIFTGMNTNISTISIKNDRIATSIDGHLAVSDFKGNLDEITDGDSREEDPSWSLTDNRIFCTTAGLARDSRGIIAAVSPRSIMAVDLDGGSIKELYSDEDYDFLKPKNNSHGNLYYIKQPYKAPQEKDPLWKDILLFPFRILKAIGGFLNAFSVIFGGESLQSGKKHGDVKTKQKSDKELYLEGKLLEAEKNEKENSAKGDKNPGILPVNRVLVRTEADGKETVIKRGVLDYTVLDNGDIICSNGKALIRIGEGGEEIIAKAKLAHSICVIK
ncbi:MAG: hypothetical protein E7497_00175 [Ruminococcus sp.]|nr:hypothetical protein [Ruminococcus sp.]